MSKKPKSMPPPDGEPGIPPHDRDGTRKSRVPETQDPLISGDARKGEKYRNADDVSVDEAGQIRKQRSTVDLLH